MPEKVKPIPEGFHTITPHLNVKNGAAAIEFYTKAFGAEVRRVVHGPDGKMIMHADLKIGDSILMLVDEMPDWNVRSPLSLGGSPVTIHLYVTNADAAFQRAVDAGAKVTMPLDNQMWGDRYGQVVDPFGHNWSIAQHIEDPSPEEIKKRMDEMSAQMGKQ